MISWCFLLCLDQSTTASPWPCGTRDCHLPQTYPRQEVNTPPTRKQQPYCIQSGRPRAHRRPFLAWLLSVKSHMGVGSLTHPPKLVLGQENVLYHLLILYREHSYRASMDRGGKDRGEGEGASGLWGHSHQCLWGASPEGSCMASTVRVSQMLASGLGLFSPTLSLLLAPAKLLPHLEGTHAPPTCPYCQIHVCPSMPLS